MATALTHGRGVRHACRTIQGQLVKGGPVSRGFDGRVPLVEPESTPFRPDPEQLALRACERFMASVSYIKRER
jgi:hypothetical protein